ncbi:MAG: cysteine--tRNA ligase [Actinomycetota bacterium]
MALMVTNTLTRRKEELRPREESKISFYVCGPTVYNHIHVGNARAAVVFDVIRRYLRWRGYDVNFVQNYTDVDDKIIARATEEGRPAEEVAREYSHAYEVVMKALNVEPPDLLVKATDHIGDMIKAIGSLIERGYAYEAGGNVWFAVEEFKGYGKLSGRSLDDVRAERVEPDPSKRSPLDFALWKAAKEGEPSWESPWGRGRPGWHIECSTMSEKYLGMGFDIHGGGSDLIFPHHENEIAQAEAATGEEPFVRVWLHNGMVNLDEQKMSKSLGNFVLVKDFLKEIRPAALRLMSIAGHYRSDIDFGEASLRQAEKTLERFEIFAHAAKAAGEVSEEGRKFLQRFTDAMDDDFNTPTAISVIHDLIKTGNIELEAAQGGDEAAQGRLEELMAAFCEMTDVLGLELESGTAAASEISGKLIDLVLELREAARQAGRYEESDKVRDRLRDLGIEIEDTKAGARWRMKS